MSEHGMIGNCLWSTKNIIKSNEEYVIIRFKDLIANPEKEIKRIEKENEDISRFKPLIKLYDRADIINDIA